MASVTAHEDRVPADIRAEVEEAFGRVPAWFDALPEHGLRAFWATMRDFDLAETALDGKTKQLIGLGVSAQIPCTYCVFFHAEAARMFGASEEEIREAVFQAATTREGSTLLNGAAVDLDDFKTEMRDVFEHIKAGLPEPSPDAPVSR